MVQSIELLFDEASEARLRGEWDALAAAGLPSLAHHEGAANRPHVTVAVADAGLDAAAAEVAAAAAEVAAAAAEVAAAWEHPVAAEIGSPLLFGGHRRRWVLARQIVATERLLAAHAAIHQAIRTAAPQIAPLEQTLPDAWTPHVTLARRMPADRLAEALSAIDVEPLPCRFVGLRLWDSVRQSVVMLSDVTP